ncbi:hypothetical protein T492DRAFT_613417 [Pavlovales sp. CCMP2436]|nr:hypothetical protein T492DRAFT_613417 [Pavlovales sp. CCMP2436]
MKQKKPASTREKPRAAPAQDVAVHRCRFVDWMPSSIECLAFGADCSRLALGRANGDIEIFSLGSSWQRELTIRGAAGMSARSLAWGDGSRLFSAGLDGFVYEWDLAALAPCRTLDVGASGIWAIDVHPGLGLIAAACEDGTVRLIRIGGEADGTNPPELSPGPTLGRHSARALCVSWQAGGPHLASGGADGSILLHHAPSRTTVQSMALPAVPGRGAVVWSVRLLADARSLLSGDSAGRVTVWDAKHGTVLTTFAEHEADVSCVAVDEDEGVCYAGGLDGKMICLQLHGRALGRAERTGGSAGGAGGVALARSKAPSSHWRWLFHSSRRIHTHDIKALVVCPVRGGMGAEEEPAELWAFSGGVDCTLCALPAAGTHATAAADNSAGVAAGGRGGGWPNATPRKLLPFPQAPSLSYADGSRALLCAHDARLQLWTLPPLATARSGTASGSGSSAGSKQQGGPPPSAASPPTAGGSARHVLDLLMGAGPVGGLARGPSSSRRGGSSAGLAPARHIMCSAISPDGQVLAASHERLRLWRVDGLGGADAAKPPAVRALALRDNGPLARGAQCTALAFGGTQIGGGGQVLFAAVLSQPPAVHALCCGTGRELCAPLPLPDAAAALGGSAEQPGGGKQSLKRARGGLALGAAASGTSGGGRSRHVQRLSLSADGTLLAAHEWALADSPGALGGGVHMLAVGGGGAALAHLSCVAQARLPSAVCALAFVPPPFAGGPRELFAVGCACLSVVLFDPSAVGHLKLVASFSVRAQLGSRLEPPLALLPAAMGASELVVVTPSALCRVELRTLADADAPAGADADAPRGPADYKRWRGSGRAKSLVPQPRVLDRYRPLLFAATTSQAELVVVERPWAAVMRALPPPVLRKRFGGA